MQQAEISIEECRKHPRYPVETQLMVLFPEFWRLHDPYELWGWTNNISEHGVGFILPVRITEPELVLHIDYEGMGAEYVLVKVLETRVCQDGWSYHCVIERSLASINALDCLAET